MDAKVAKRFAEVVEVAYEPEADDARWLGRLLEHAAPLLDDGLGVIGYRAVRAPGGGVTIGRPVALGASTATVATLVVATSLTPAAVLERVYFSTPPVTTYSEAVGSAALLVSPVARVFGAITGIRDFLTVRAVDPEGRCLVIGVPRRSVRSPDPELRWTLERVGAHLASADRLRRRPSVRPDGLPGGSEAVIVPGRGVVHAEGEAEGAVRAIYRAAVRLDRARGEDAGQRVLDAWTALVEARWSVVEHIETDGRRFLVARRNAARASGPGVLSERERQVACLAVLGHSQKLTAYELGLSPSTVGTLERRAMRKLGVRSRTELVTLLTALGRSR